MPNGTNVQKFGYGSGVETTFHEVPFLLGEKHQQLVKGKWNMEVLVVELLIITDSSTTCF